MLTTFFVFEPGRGDVRERPRRRASGGRPGLGGVAPRRTRPAATATSAMIDTINAAVPRVPRTRFILQLLSRSWRSRDLLRAPPGAIVARRLRTHAERGGELFAGTSTITSTCSPRRTRGADIGVAARAEPGPAVAARCACRARAASMWVLLSTPLRICSTAIRVICSSASSVSCSARSMISATAGRSALLWSYASSSTERLRCLECSHPPVEPQPIRNRVRTKREDEIEHGHRLPLTAASRSDSTSQQRRAVKRLGPAGRAAGARARDRYAVRWLRARGVDLRGRVPGLRGSARSARPSRRGRSPPSALTGRVRRRMIGA